AAGPPRRPAHRPLRDAGPSDRRPAAVIEGRGGDFLPARDPVWGPRADAGGGARGGSGRAARGRGPEPREGPLSALARDARRGWDAAAGRARRAARRGG